MSTCTGGQVATRIKRGVLQREVGADYELGRVPETVPLDQAWGLQEMTQCRQVART